MAVTIQIKYDPEHHLVKAIPTVWPCKAWKLPRVFVESLKARLPEEINEFDVCGVYLLLSKTSVYVGEAEQVITRLKQHAARPPFDWDEAIAFISKEQSLEKSHIKYLEHEIFCLLKSVGNYKIENTSTPTRSHVGDEDTMQAYRKYIINLTEVFGYSDVFFPLKPSAKPCERDQQDTNSPCSPSEKITISSFIENGIKAQDIARHALRKALEDGLLTDDDLAFLCNKESARHFHGGGVPILKTTNGDPNDSKDVHGLSRYNTKIATFNGTKYLISHELYNKPGEPQQDSRQPLIDYLVNHGLEIDKIFSICKEGMGKK